MFIIMFLRKCCKHGKVDISSSLPSDLKLYIILDFVKKKNHWHFKNKLNYKAKRIMMTEILHTEYKWCASRWYWTSDCLELFKVR